MLQTNQRLTCSVSIALVCLRGCLESDYQPHRERHIEFHEQTFRSFPRTVDINYDVIKMSSIDIEWKSSTYREVRCSLDSSIVLSFWLIQNNSNPSAD